MNKNKGDTEDRFRSVNKGTIDNISLQQKARGKIEEYKLQ